MTDGARLCKCHDEPMRWTKATGAKPGYFRCVVKIREAQRRYRVAHREKIAESARLWAQANPEKISEGRRRYRAAHPEKRREEYRRWKATHGDYHAEYRATHGEEIRERERLKEKRRLRIRAGGLRFSYPVDPKNREKVRQQLADFKAKQQTEYREVFDGRVN